MGVPDPIDTSFARAILAYRAGRERPPAMGDGPSGELFRSRAQAFIRARLDDQAHDHYASIRDLARAAVAEARAGRFDLARERFGAAEDFLQSIDASPEVRLLSRSWIDQAFAYFAVRLRDWDQARARLTSAMQADLALEDEYGYDIFHIGRVHTLHLWLRTQGESGDRTGAVAQAQAIIDYVHGRTDSVAIGSGWSRARAGAVPDDLKLAMTLRVCSEAGTQVALAGDDAAAAFSRFTAWRDWSDHPVLSEVHEWAHAKQAFLDGNTRDFLLRITPFLARGRRETTLWYTAADDLCRACEAVRPAATRPFIDDVKSDVADWRRLPPDIQAPSLFGVVGHAEGRAYRHQVQPKRFEVFTVGLPRTGSTSLYTLFANFRSGNEFMERETVSKIVARHNGDLSADDLRDYLRRRIREADLEMDSASFHHLYFDFLLAEHPDARFIMTIRAPYEWANSYIKMIAGWRRRFIDAGESLPQWMEDYGVMLFGDFSWDWVASPATIAERAEPLADAFIKHWATANRRILSSLPEGRSCVVRTEELSQSCDRIAEFVGVPAMSLTDQHHSNIHPDRSDLLSGLGRAWVDARARAYGADVLAATGISTERVTA